MSSLAGFAGALDSAALTAQAMPQLSTQTSIDVEAAYEIQRLLIGHREARGERVVGIKLGFTSREKIRQMGVSDLIWGRLTDGMIIEDGGSVEPGDYVHPRAEPEIAFLLRKPLAGRITLAQAGAAIEAVAPAVELIDSRYSSFRFNLSDVIADNCSSSGFVVGPWSHPDMDVSNLGMLLEFNGRAVQWGSSAAILGHPLRSLVSAARLAAQCGIELQAGWIVLAGAATAAHALEAGVHVRATVEKLGTAGFTFGR